jgi:lipoyl(octanoyl) transferase
MDAPALDRRQPFEWRITTGLVPYPEAVAAMEARAAAVRTDGAPALAWLLEHPPLYTAGTSADPAELLDAGGLPVHRSGRGGRFTYHGPGQRILYLVVDLKPEGDVRRHVERLEAVVIRVLAGFGVTGERRAGRIGVWVADGQGGEAKIAAIGVRVRHWVAFHGLALNVAPDLAHFAGIVPCGIRGHGVTSLAALGRQVTMAEVDAAFMRELPRVFARQSGVLHVGD